MGAPLFLLALSSTQTQEVCKAFFFKSKLYQHKKTAEAVPDLYFHHNFLHLLYNVLKVLIDSNP